MADWSVMDRDWPFNQFDPFQFCNNQYLPENPEVPPCLPPPAPPPPPPPPPMPPPPPPAQAYLPPPSTALAAMLYQEPSTSRGLPYATPQQVPPPKGDNPREIRNKAEKQRRDKLNQSIGELASMVPPVVAASRKIDKTGVLRLTAHYLRAHQYVFGDSVGDGEQFSAMSSRALLSLLNGFLLTTTYRGLIVVVSQNVKQYLGYNEIDLLGQSVFNIIHEDDHQLLRNQLMPKIQMLGPNGELLVPDEPEGKRQVAEILANEKRRFIIRFKKLGQRSEPSQYVTCHVEGSLRKADRACRGYNRCCQMVRRARARGDKSCSSGNDVVFVGIVRLAKETFITESNMEWCRMEYRTRHAVDGQIIQTENRISLVTGYMTHEVNGVNAMNFMHRDDVRWVVIALREMYDQHRLFGESCYRLMTKNGEFIYLKTRGRLEVDSTTRAVTSFVCTNTIVDELEGKQLIKMMKKKFMLMVNNNDESLGEIEEIKDSNEQSLAVEDPRQLEKVILHLVTNLPSPQSEDDHQGESPDHGVPPTSRLAIIPPRKEKIVSAIEKIYSVIKTLPQESGNSLLEESAEASAMAYRRQSTRRNPQLHKESSRQTLMKQASDNAFSKLPNFNEVYQRRHTETTATLQELSPYNANTIRSNSTRAVTSTMTRPMSELPSSNYSGLATITSIPMNMMSNNNNNSMPAAAEKPTGTVKYHLYVTPVSNQIPNEPVNGIGVSMPSTSSVGAGTKRPREYTDLDVASKKKTTEPIAKPQEKTEEDVSTYLDASIDEALTYPQIESVMNTLEQVMDPAFPELMLMSQEVEDILHQIDETPPKDKADN